MSERIHDPVLPGFADMARRHRELSARLVASRQQMGLSQTVVAARMGTSQSAVARIESGASDVLLSSLARYAAALNLSLEVHLEGDDPSRGD
jgi:transcriptional regulator with XRE-family HTH domain